MTKYSPEDQRVLDWVNRIRGKKGLKPRKTIPRESHKLWEKYGYSIGNSCPLGVAIRGWMGYDSYSLLRAPFLTGSTKECPKYIIRWVEDFDEGKKPQYEGLS